MTTKICPGADKVAHVLDTSLFAKNRSRADGLSVYCKSCGAQKQRDWKHAHPEKVKQAAKDGKAAKRLRSKAEALA